MVPSSPRPKRLRITLTFSAYPIQASLGALGRKWALHVLMHIALGRAQRFNELLRATPGMSKRILALRLRDLERNGFLVRAEQRPGYLRWQLAEKGADVVPVLLTLLHFGAKWRQEGPPPIGEAGSSARTFQVAYAPGSARRTPRTPPKGPG